MCQLVQMVVLVGTYPIQRCCPITKEPPNPRTTPLVGLLGTSSWGSQVLIVGIPGCGMMRTRSDIEFADGMAKVCSAPSSKKAEAEF